MVVRNEPATYPCGSCHCDADGRDLDGATWTVPGIVEKSPICPRRLITPASSFYLDLYRHYRNGVLPVAGGLLDQPYVYMRAMTIIEEWSSAGKP